MSKYLPAMITAFVVGAPGGAVGLELSSERLPLINGVG
jgi:hypothetical protein